MVNEKRHTCFLKVTDYQKKYLEMKYGSPVCFPSGSMIQLYLRRYLVRNATMKHISNFSCSYAAFHYKPSGPLFSSEYQLIKEEERKEYIEIEVPDEVMYGGKLVKVDQFFQLNPQGERSIRKEIKNEFWMGFSQFRDECIFRAARTGDSVNTEYIMSDFMNMCDIDMGQFENMMRNWWRVKSRMFKRIESKRDEVEDKKGITFFYT